ncbi:DUF916 domain-containing protein [Candidatus Gracilibacteria bacterium]|nr:DUF916 domain-containing protein [Candidatus Gracilibacteria bacterium]
MSIPIKADVGIIRQDNQYKKNSKNGWFVYQMKAGEEIEDVAVLTNSTNSDQNVEIYGRDAEITSDGIYTVVSNKLQNKDAGNWVKFEKNIINVPAATTIEVPFKVQVPEGTVSGEYGAGVAVLSIDDNKDGGANVVVKTRNAVRMYITVVGDLKLDSEVKDLNIIDPTDEDYASERNTRGYIGCDNIVAKYTAKNVGNVYSNLNGKYKITFPDKQVKEGEVNSLLAPGYGERTFYVRSDLLFQAGEIKLEFNFQTGVLNEINEGKVKMVIFLRCFLIQSIGLKNRLMIVKYHVRELLRLLKKKQIIYLGRL